jgi:hypothetical protein
MLCGAQSLNSHTHQSRKSDEAVGFIAGQASLCTTPVKRRPRDADALGQ